LSRIDPCNLRQIHLDFHTPGFVPVADQFNAKSFFDTLAAARVNSISFFAKCHHGYSYFDSKIGTPHPGMSCDLFGEAAAEAEARGMGFLSYFSLNVDEVIAEKHPEWVALFRDGRPVDSQILQDGSELYWRWLCPNKGGYLDEFFFPHVEECLANYPMDGIFIDMAGYLPDSCFCDKCVSAMHALRLDPDNPIDHTKFNSASMQAFARRLRETMDRYRPGMRLEIGCYNAWGEARKAPGTISEFYVESLSYQTGWFHLPVMGRYVSNTGVPVTGMTGRFLKNWGDFGTVLSPHQLKLQVGQHLSIGASCTIGDHLHCNGRLEPAVYDVIGEAFSHVERLQPYCSGMERAREAAILVPEGVETNSAVGTGKGGAIDIHDCVNGAGKLFMEGHIQWDVIDPSMPLDDLTAAILVHPYLTNDYIDKLEAFVTGGGTLIVDANGILAPDSVAARWRQFIGVESAKMSEHPGSFYRLIDPDLAAGVPDMANYAHAPSVEIRAAAEAIEHARAIHSPCVRSREHFYGHFHGPDMVETGPAIISVARGAGRVVVLAQALFAAYLNTGYHAHRTLLHNIFNLAMPERLVTTDAPTIMEITAGKKGGRMVLQFLGFVADRRHRYSFESANETIPLAATVELRTDKPVTRLFEPISGQKITFSETQNGIKFTTPPVVGHLMVLVE
jgi:hypothetical protein